VNNIAERAPLPENSIGRIEALTQRASDATKSLVVHKVDLNGVTYHKRIGKYSNVLADASGKVLIVRLVGMCKDTDHMEKVNVIFFQ